MSLFVYDIDMKAIIRFGHNLLDFLFPKSPSLVALESMSASEILNTLPRTENQKAANDDSLIILFDYKDERVRELIWELKYKGNKIIARKFGDIILDILRVEIAERSLLESIHWQNPIMIPMPTSNKRRRERGYNQIEILCAEIIKQKDIEFIYSPNNLKKIIHTESQARTHATKRERVSNLEGTFEVTNPQEIKGRCVILVDDVTTTGATLNEAKRTLMGAQARRILCVALAH